MSGYRTQTAFAWPDAAVDRLRAMKAKGDPSSAIAKALSLEFGHAITRNSVIGKSMRLGIEMPVERKKITMALAHPKKAPKPRSAQERTNTNAVRQRRAADLMRTAKEKAERVVVPFVENADLIAAAPCCIMDLTHASCRWPLNRTAPDGETLFCANSKEEGRSYCQGHSRRAYTRTVSNEQRLAEKRQIERNRDAAYAAGLRDRVFGFGMAKRFA